MLSGTVLEFVCQLALNVTYEPYKNTVNMSQVPAGYVPTHK